MLDTCCAFVDLLCNEFGLIDGLLFELLEAFRSGEGIEGKEGIDGFEDERGIDRQTAFDERAREEMDTVASDGVTGECDIGVVVVGSGDVEFLNKFDDDFRDATEVDGRGESETFARMKCVVELFVVECADDIDGSFVEMG